MYSPKRQFGNIGENFAVYDLESRDFKIIERNYLKKWGEIDIVAFKQGRKPVLHFIEVKTVSYKGEGSEVFRPEENVHYEKLRKLHRTIETFLLEHKRQYSDTDFVVDVACVYLVDNNLKKIEWIENVIL